MAISFDTLVTYCLQKEAKKVCTEAVGKQLWENIASKLSESPEHDEKHESKHKQE